MLRISILILGLWHAAATAAVELDQDLNGSWWNPAQDGQGFVIHVIPEANQIFVAWFTYETSGGRQMWITGSGTLNENPVQLQLLRPAGGALGATEPLPELTPWGTGTLEFTSCTGGRFSYQGPSEGEIEIERLTPASACATGGAQ